MGGPGRVGRDHDGVEDQDGVAVFFVAERVVSRHPRDVCSATKLAGPECPHSWAMGNCPVMPLIA